MCSRNSSRTGQQNHSLAAKMKLHFFFFVFPPVRVLKCTRLVRNPESFTFVSSRMAATRFADAELNSELAKSNFCGQAPGAAGAPLPSYTWKWSRRTCSLPENNIDCDTPVTKTKHESELFPLTGAAAGNNSSSHHRFRSLMKAKKKSAINVRLMQNVGLLAALAGCV